MQEGLNVTVLGFNIGATKSSNSSQSMSPPST
jgi:hypothetical protein